MTDPYDDYEPNPTYVLDDDSFCVSEHPTGASFPMRLTIYTAGEEDVTLDFQTAVAADKVLSMIAFVMEREDPPAEAGGSSARKEEQTAAV